MEKLKDVLWLKTMDTWATKVFYLFFPVNQVDWDWGFTSNCLMFLVGFFLAIYGWRMADGKRTQWLGFLILRKTERTAEFVEGKGELERKRLCVYISSGRSMARGLAEARSPLSFSISFIVSSLFIASLSSCFFLRDFMASLSI